MWCGASQSGTDKLCGLRWVPFPLWICFLIWLNGGKEQYLLNFLVYEKCSQPGHGVVLSVSYPCAPTQPPGPQIPCMILFQKSQLLLAILQLYWPPAVSPSGPLPCLFPLSRTLAPVSLKLPLPSGLCSQVTFSVRPLSLNSIFITHSLALYSVLFFSFNPHPRTYLLICMCVTEKGISVWETSIGCLPITCPNQDQTSNLSS